MLLHPLQSLDPTEGLKLDPHEKPNLERSFFVLSELHFGQTTRSSFFARVSKLCPQSSHLNSNIGIWISPQKRLLDMLKKYSIYPSVIARLAGQVEKSPAPDTLLSRNAGEKELNLQENMSPSIIKLSLSTL